MPSQFSSPTSVAAASTPNYVAPAELVPSSGWFNVDAVKAKGDSIFAESQPIATQWIRTTGYGFGVPAGATITGVMAIVVAAGNGLGTGHIHIAGLKLIVNNSIQGDDLRSGSPGAAEGLQFPDSPPGMSGTGWASIVGSDADWGLALTPTVVNAVDFGVAIGFEGHNTVAAILCESIALLINYTEPTEITTDVVFAASVSSPGASVQFVAAVSKVTSADVTFRASVAAGATVTTPNPTSCPTITTAAMVIEWTMPLGANGFRVVIYSDNSGTGDVLYDSGYVGSSATTHTVPVGKLPAPATGLYLRLTVTDANGQTTVGDLICFNTSFPTSVNVAGVAARAVGDGCDSPVSLPGIRVTWLQVTPGGSETFLTYDVRRRRAGATLWESIATLGIVSTLFYVDHNVLAGQIYEYSVVWRATQGASTLQSADTAAVTAKSTFEFAWLHTGSLQSNDPNFEHVRLESWQADTQLMQEAHYTQPWGRSLPNVYIGQALGHRISVPLHPRLLTDGARWSRLLGMVELQRDQGVLLCLRFGRAKLMYYVTLDGGLSRSDAQKTQTVNLVFRETFTEMPA